MSLRQGSAQILPRTPGPPGMSKNKKQGGAHRKPRMNDENASIFGPHQTKDNIAGNAANFATPLGPKRTVLAGKDTNVIKERTQPTGKQQYQPRTTGRSSTKTRKTVAVHHPRDVTPMQLPVTPSVQPELDNSLQHDEIQNTIDHGSNRINPERLNLQRLILNDAPEDDFPDIEYMPPREPELPFVPDDDLDMEQLKITPEEPGTALIDNLSMKNPQDETMSYIDDDGISYEELLANISNKRSPIKPSRSLQLNNTPACASSHKQKASSYSKTPNYMSLTASARIRREASLKSRDGHQSGTIRNFKSRSESPLPKVDKSKITGTRSVGRDIPAQTSTQQPSIFAEQDELRLTDHDKEFDSLYFNDF